MADRRTLLIIVAVVLGFAVVGGILEAVEAPGPFGVMFLVPFGLLFNPLVLIVVLIVWLNRRGQQQQQQVVVQVGGDDPNEVKVRCASCKSLNRRNATFCGQCGGPIGRPRR